MESKIVVLEEIAATTKSLLKDLRDDLRAIRDKQETDFRLLTYMGAGAVLAVVGLMAKGFHWL